MMNNSDISFNPTCGIIGYVGKTDSAINYLIEGLGILQNRGYDSAGVATLSKTKVNPGSTDTDKENATLKITKFASVSTTSDAIDKLAKNAPPIHEGDKIGIAHTRWATHGGKTDLNAHPHVDYLNRIALCHNGVIENCEALVNQFKLKEKLKTQTDTEIIAQVIGYFLDQNKTIEEAICSTLCRLEGTWGLAILFKDKPDRIFCVRKGSPLLIGVTKDGRTFVASEATAFARHTRSIITLENDELAIITEKGVEDIIDINDPPSPRKDKKEGDKSDELKEKAYMERVTKSEVDDVVLTPAPYEHWTIKEIMEQPESLSRAMNYGGRIRDDISVKMGGLEMNKQWLLNIKHLVIAACGTSFYSALYGAKLFKLLKCFETVQVFDAAELSIEDFPPNDSGLLVISQSGETLDVVRCLDMAIANNIPIFSIVNRVGSLIARTTACGVYINAGREIAVASTKAFTSQVAVLTLIALFFAQNKYAPQFMFQDRINLVNALQKLPTQCGMTLNSTRKKCARVASYLLQHTTVFVLGKDLGEPIAREGSLKIKEITYTHAEGYASGALKHGPFALIEPGTPIILIILDDKNKNLGITAAHEVKARGAFVVVITDLKKTDFTQSPMESTKIQKKLPDPSKTNDLMKKICDEIIRVPHNHWLSGLNCVFPLQLIAYEMAIQKKINPDKPKNLAKTVTVA